MTICLVIDIDDTLYIHNHDIPLNYNNISHDYKLKRLLNKITLPKFILTNATFDHANIILNKTGVVNHFEKIYSRDNLPEMKPNLLCYQSVEKDINRELQSNNNGFILFDDLIENLQGAKRNGWFTIWISPNYNSYYKYNFIDKAYPSLNDALFQLNF
jgi:FMN phosphatase YigB (HAD superfamily)